MPSFTAIREKLFEYASNDPRRKNIVCEKLKCIYRDDCLEKCGDYECMDCEQ